MDPLNSKERKMDPKNPKFNKNQEILSLKNDSWWFHKVYEETILFISAASSIATYGKRSCGFKTDFRLFLIRNAKGKFVT